MFKALCRGVRNHTMLSFVIFCIIGAGGIASIMRKVPVMSEGEELAIVACAVIFLIIASAYLCSFLAHCAYAMDYMEQHPLVEAKEAWNETKCCINIGEDGF